MNKVHLVAILSP